MPPAALANDMMIFYAPSELYTHDVTVMEMICASVCLTSMICFTLEAKYRKENPFDSEVHMARHRMGARGNATSFPLPWLDLLLELQRQEQNLTENVAPDLPWVGEELSDFVSVLLKTSEQDNPEDLAKFIHQAVVRRHVVLELIANAKARGHRAYRCVDMSAVEAKAARLPENGVPPEIVRLLPHDNSLDKIQVQKAATPVSGRSDLSGVINQMERSQPNAVVLERSNEDAEDINAQRIAALRLLDEKLRSHSKGQSHADGAPGTRPTKRLRRSQSAPPPMICPQDDRRVPRLAMTTGSSLMDQFEPWYFGVAFAFLFKYCTGMPDMPEWNGKQRYRRGEEAPRVDPSLWVRIMSRRVEAQISRDWHFGFSSWNYLFRCAVNMSRTVYSYESALKEDGEPLTAKDLQDGAICIFKALQGSYVDMNGRRMPVNGDMTKVRYVSDLSVAAKRLLQNLEHTSRKMAGTQETRRIMRFDTHGNRVKYGVPIFITFTPDEGHSMIMIRLSRTRRRDPVFAKQRDEVGARFADRRRPELGRDFADDVFLDVPLEDLRSFLPSHDERRKLLARDALATVDGFRVIVSVTYEFLFGMRVCSNCPHCNLPKQFKGPPCQDIFGSNSTPEGGVFGRCDSAYTSIEAQKSRGSLHAHTQLFVQCLHQHTPLVEIFARIRSVGGGEIVDKYLRYKAHVCRQEYASVANIDSRLEVLEKEWPEYETARALTSQPAYLTRRSSALAMASGDVSEPAHSADASVGSSSSGNSVSQQKQSLAEDGTAWLAEHLEQHVQSVQEYKQHHVHIYNEETKSRVPLTHCQRKDNPKLCKGDFPRTRWLIDRAVVLCQGIIERMGMALTGRRSKLGSLHGPMNHESLNGTHGAMLAAHQSGNSDVQLPYRFPVCTATHACEQNCLDLADENAIVEAAQVAQDAQAGSIVSELH